MHCEEEMRESERDRAAGSLESDPGGVAEPAVSAVWWLQGQLLRA